MSDTSTDDAGDLAAWKARAEAAEAALERLRAGIEAHADQIEPKLDQIEDYAAAIGDRLWRASGIATAAGIALHELGQIGTVRAHTRTMLAAAVRAYQAGRKEMERAAGPAPAEQSALEQMIIAAKIAGAKGIWLIRGAMGAALLWTDRPDVPASEWWSLVVQEPHELVILIRVPKGDGGEAGVEFR